MTVAGEQIRWDEVERELVNHGRWKATGRRQGAYPSITHAGSFVKFN
ncbi:hypothetical protein AQPE_4238 [Aquipluma nitroreducens]|uniref:Uncharacterized protein n=1 Tax=Aquipluma nitroreducens TaxID=2010828 RepID=A0A5K7SF36_9BACT|nr:hypothetical protein AQPE_4238 [Aquipluma nitroreducens]